MELEVKICNVISIGKASCKPFLWVQAKYYAWTIELLMRCSPAMFQHLGQPSRGFCNIPIFVGCITIITVSVGISFLGPVAKGGSG
jgi:hypothetical protein